MGKQTQSSIGRHIEYHISIPKVARMVHYCKVFDSNNNSTDERLSFHKFPDDPKLRKVGITDSNLSWNDQAVNVALKISKTIGIIARLRHF